MRRVLRGGGCSGRGGGALALVVSALLLFSVLASLRTFSTYTGVSYVVDPPGYVKCDRMWQFGKTTICRTTNPMGAKSWAAVSVRVPPAPRYSPDGDPLIHMAVHGNSSLTGRGVVVAVVDTGIDYTHEAFDGAIVEMWTLLYRTGGGGLVHWVMGVNGSLSDLLALDNTLKSNYGEYAFMDEHGHGTHIAGVIAGRRVGSWRGVAPEAKLIVIKMFSRGGTTTYETALDALQLVYEIAEEKGIRVVNLSWGASVLSDGEDPLSRAASAIARDKGVIVNVAAGNEGNRPLTLNIPAAGKRVVAVGALDPFTKKIAEFSSWGPTADLRMKPDIVAAGVSIVGPRSSRSSLPPYSGDPRLTRLSGTSMATAVASGIAALYVEAFAVAGIGGDPTESFLAYSRTWRYNPYFKDFISGVGLPVSP
jgi:subtilisin family serine protease